MIRLNYSTFIFLLSLTLMVFTSKVSGQCLDPIIYYNHPDIHVSLDYFSNPSTFTFESNGCLPCQWQTLPNYDPEYVDRCLCKDECITEAEDAAGYWYNQCDSTCRAEYGAFEYNYTLLNNCQNSCISEYPNYLEEYLENCQNNCGYLPTPNIVTS